MNQIFQREMPRWHAPNDDRIPTGAHRVAVITSNRLLPQTEFLPYYVFRYMVVGKGRFAGRIIDDIFRLEDPNPSIRATEYQRLSMLCHAVDVLQIKASTQELHGRPFEIGVMTVGRLSIVESYASVRPGSPTYKTPGTEPDEDDYHYDQAMADAEREAEIMAHGYAQMHGPR
ncbi:hypothetical protein [Mesorhizobium sp.]|uniref:hypothetical protein n=1 Tax=Mesorhizobium sp. TaxID=1871066 RepID=UPI000FE98430|nr:hypothetical protein [Mesorhizobium sp.]RWO89555.1 MAG: hypothetical protein EOQ96_05185 [Mesorhizobium sp.]